MLGEGESGLLPAEGRDVYRNFVVPTGLETPRFIKGVAFRPGNSRVVHHAFVKVDATGAARRLDAQDAAPGFGGMNSQAQMPDGQFLGWQPGRIDAFGPPGLPWRLNPGEDLVLEMHLNPSGKPEPVQEPPEVVFDFRTSRSGAHVRQFLGHWRGSLMVDDYGGYKAGFAGGITDATANGAAHNVFLAAIPMAVLGAAGAFAMTRRR